MGRELIRERHGITEVSDTADARMESNRESGKIEEVSTHKTIQRHLPIHTTEPPFLTALTAICKLKF
jgi:hypothetical protein